MQINFHNINVLLLGLNNFNSELSISIDKLRNNNKKNEKNLILKTKTKIEEAIIDIQRIKERLNYQSITNNDKVKFQHYITLLNQNYPNIESNFQSKYSFKTISIITDKVFEDTSKNKAKPPQFNGVTIKNKKTTDYQQKENNELNIHDEKNKTLSKPKIDKPAINISEIHTDIKNKSKGNTIEPIKENNDRVTKEVPFQNDTVSNNILKTMYGLYPDMPDGFQDQYLSETRGEGFVYELQFHSNTDATFLICENNDAYQKALSNSRFILKTACNYLNNINSGNKIITVKKGTVQKSGEIWKIMSKAEIKFV